MTLQANGFDWEGSNRAKCEKHGLSIAVIESLLRARWPFSRTRPTRSGRTVFAPSAERIKGAAYSSYSLSGARAMNF